MDFMSRHIGPSPTEQAHMLGTLGYASLDELTSANSRHAACALGWSSLGSQSAKRPP